MATTLPIASDHPQALGATLVSAGSLLIALLALLAGVAWPAWRRRAAFVVFGFTVLGAATIWLIPSGGHTASPLADPHAEREAGLSGWDSGLASERIVLTALAMVCAVFVVLPGYKGQYLQGGPGLLLNLAVLVMYLTALLIFADAVRTPRLPAPAAAWKSRVALVRLG